MRYIAFLRAINVGGHVVKMADLKKVFESMGFDSVETFIASGNVIFEARGQSIPALERRISAGLGKELGYEVVTFVRTEKELAAIAAHEPFSPGAMARATVVNVAFTDARLRDEHRAKLESFTSELDDFAARDREVYWRCSVRTSESNFQSAKFEKTMGIKATWRNLNTVRRLADRYPPRKKAARLK